MNSRVWFFSAFSLHTLHRNDLYLTCLIRSFAISPSWISLLLAFLWLDLPHRQWAIRICSLLICSILFCALGLVGAVGSWLVSLSLYWVPPSRRNPFLYFILLRVWVVVLPFSICYCTALAFLDYHCHTFECWCSWPCICWWWCLYRFGTRRSGRCIHWWVVGCWCGLGLGLWFGRGSWLSFGLTWLGIAWLVLLCTVGMSTLGTRAVSSVFACLLSTLGTDCSCIAFLAIALIVILVRSGALYFTGCLRRCSVGIYFAASSHASLQYYSSACWETSISCFNSWISPSTLSVPSPSIALAQCTIDCMTLSSTATVGLVRSLH